MTSGELLRRLEKHGLLLLSDARLPSVASLVAGEPIRGSWWGHPRGRAIFAALGALHDQPDVALVKLVEGKRTFVHRRLWPALLAVGRAREPWQMKRLPAAAADLLGRLEQAREPLADPAGKLLEERLLVYGEAEHTERGRHETRYQSWAAFARSRRVKPVKPTPEAARRELEAAAALLAADAPAPRLPWAPRRSPR